MSSQKKRGTTAVVSAAFLLGLAASVSLAYAQSESNPHGAVCEKVQIGDYQELGFWQKVKLSASSFLNPALANRAAISYAYPISVLKKPQATKTLDAWIKNSQATLSIERPHKPFEVISPQEALRLVAKWKEVPTDKSKFVIISKFDNFLNVTPTHTLISFSPSEPCP